MSRTVYLDMDEVLCDFVGGACKIWGVSQEQVLQHWPVGTWGIIGPISDALGRQLTDEEFWAPINGSTTFWESLEPLPWAEAVIKTVSDYTNDWKVVTAPTVCPWACAGKMLWLKNMFGKNFYRFHLTGHKEDLGQRNRILIDDHEQNVFRFCKRGGSGIVFPRHHNTLYTHKDDPVLYLRRALIERS